MSIPETVWMIVMAKFTQLLGVFSLSVWVLEVVCCINCFNYSSQLPLSWNMHSKSATQRHRFAKQNTNSFKFQAPNGVDPSPSLWQLSTLPNPNLRGLHNAAITFITSTFSMQMCSLQTPTRGGPSKPPDTQLTFPFHLWAPFRIHFTAGWGPANVSGSCKSGGLL